MTRVLLSLSLLLPVTFVACGDAEEDEETDQTCDGNGYFDEDHGHCHCDDGYDLTADGMGCEPEESDDGSDGSDGSDGTSGGDAFSPDTVTGSVITLSDGSKAWLLEARDGDTWLSIENYPSYGGATGPETRTLDATETDYATCGVCLLLQTDCEVHGDHGHCGATFMPEAGGEVTFDALGQAAGESWAGTLTDVRFVEVEIGSDYSTTVVAGGGSFVISDWSFDVSLDAD